MHRLNPLTKLVLAFSLVLISFISPLSWTPHLIAVIVIIPLVFAGRVAGDYVRAAVRLIIPAAAFLFIMQALFHPLEGTELFRIWFLHPTRESTWFAFLNSTRIFVVVSSFTIFLLTTHPSELMSDLTRRGLPGQISYVIISTLQILPQMQAKAQTIIAAQRARGLNTEGSFVRRAGSLVPLLGPLLFGSLVEVEERAIAIEARGFTSTHTKTSLYEIPDTGIDKALRSILLLLILAVLALRIWLS